MSFVGSCPKCPQLPGLNRAKARSLEPHLSLSYMDNRGATLGPSPLGAH